MFYTNIWPKGQNLEAVNVDHHYMYADRENKFKSIGLFNKYSTLLNNRELSGLWSHKYLSKHMFKPRHPMLSNGGLFTFKFGYMVIYAVAVFPPGTEGFYSEIPGIFKIVAYDKSYKLPNSKIPTDARHELALMERLLLVSNTLDVMIIMPMQRVEFSNYMDLPKTINILRKTIILHCPVLKWMYLFSSFKSYKMFFGSNELPISMLYTLYLTTNFNLTHILNEQKYLTVDSLIHFVDKNIDLNFSTSGFMHATHIYKNVKQEPAYSELGSLLLPEVKNIFGIDFINHPEKLQEKFYEKFKKINDDMANTEIKLINDKAYTKGKDLNPLMTLFLEFIHIWDCNNTRFYEFGKMDKNSLKIKVVSTSVEAWSFNFLIPIYFYYNEDLLIHIKDSLKYFDSVIGPYTFNLNEQLDNMCNTVSFGSNKLTKEDAKIMLKSIIQIYFMLTLLASYNKDSIVFDNLDDIELNKLTMSEYEQYIKIMLENLFNVQISKSVILDDLFFLDNYVIIDPIVHKVVLCTYKLKNNITIKDYDKIDFYDVINMSYMMKLYYKNYYYFLQQLLKFGKLDNYLIGG